MTDLELSGEVETPTRKTRRKRVEKTQEEIEARSEVRSEPDPNERVTIILDNGDQIPKNGLMIGHNGVMYLLKAGVPARVPRALLNVLNDAVQGFPVQDPESLQVVEYQDRMRYPYRLVSG
jgi:hemin uptake protein HemP